MGNYNLSTYGAVCDAAVQAKKDEKAYMALPKYHDPGKYTFMIGYRKALEDVVKQMGPTQSLIDKLFGYLGEHYDSSELYRLFHEDMGMTDDEIEFLGFDLDVEPMGSSGVEYVRDFENGFKIQKVFANRLLDGSYGDIYDLKTDAQREHPGEEVIVGYCVVDVVDEMVPIGCNDWNNTVEEAAIDYKEHVVPGLEVRNMEVSSWEDMNKKYPMCREDMTEEQEEDWVADCYKLYEKEGFSPRYWSLFTDNAERIGQKIEIIGRSDNPLEVLPMWKARFEDGHVVNVYPEEVIPGEMKANGCKWFEDVLVYDRELSEKMIDLDVDVMPPQEMADAMGKAVKDGNKYYLPKVIEKPLEEKLAEAQDRTIDANNMGAQKREKEGLF